MLCLLLLASAALGGCSALISPSEVEERNPRQWPFVRHSIWNLPLGADTSRVEAQLSASLGTVFTIVVLTPEAPLTPLKQNEGAWNDSRCITTGPKLFDLPLPIDFIVSRTGETPPPDHWVVLASDGHTLHEGSPFGRCEEGGAATTISVGEGGDLFGDGLLGGQPDSDMSILGGTLRRGELLPGGPPVRHALKLGLPEVALSAAGKGYRWPARRAPGNYETFGGLVSALKIGALLALPRGLDVEGEWLATEAARALAWTLQHYGAYVVHGFPATNRAYLFAEQGPEGTFEAAFEAAWGFSFSASDTDFAADLKLILGALEVVDSWTETGYAQVVASDGRDGAGGGATLLPWTAALYR